MAEAPTGLDQDAPFEDVAIGGVTSKAGRERLQKLNYLLKASGIYSKIIADNIERERKTREEAQQKQEKKVEKAAPAPPSASAHPGEARKTRAGAHNAAASASAASTASPRKPAARSRKPGKGDGGREEAPEVSSLLPTTEAAKAEEGLGRVGQPALITGASLRSYQLAGMHWLATLYENGLNGILADEMGLGKTLQTIAFLCYLRERGVWGPFLVVCPLSTVANWVSEFERFCPEVPCILYHGTPAERAELRRTRLTPPEDAKGAWVGGSGGPAGIKAKNVKGGGTGKKGKNTTATFPIVVTSYELVMNDRKWLGGFAWRYIVVDESHRLKNLECKLVQELKSYSSANRLLLTGTPLHNNLKELWSLLNFILPEIFDDYSSFEQWFDLSNVTSGDAADTAAALSNAQTQHIVQNLHAILKPFLLRRMKQDVETGLPKKKEYLLSAPLTAQQKELYDAVINRTLRRLLLDRAEQTQDADSGEDSDAALEEEEQEAEESEGEPAAKRRKTTRAPEAPRSLIKALKTKPGGNGQRGSVGVEKNGTKAQTVESSDEDSVLANTSRRQALQRRTARRRDYSERSDAQFFHEVDTGISLEIDKGVQSALSSLPETKKGRRAQEAVKGVNQMKLQNMIMQARKVCNHPWLFDWPVDKSTGEYVVNEGLVAASGKMLLLDKLLGGLFARGHKVLLFSQFTSMLDIIEDWAVELKDWKICRIDGTTKQDERRAQMKEFNESKGEEGKSACNLFLLSTRAGGVGINLVAADTVILYDSDWNPQQDLQAQDRAHRIGQTKPVLVFRLVSGNTVESKILQRAGEKRKLEALVIGQGFNVPGSDVQEILGNKKARNQQNMAQLAEALLKTDGEKFTMAEQGDEIISEESLAMLLDRSDEAMNRKLGWHTQSSAAGVEVFETKRGDQPDAIAQIPKPDAEE